MLKQHCDLCEQGHVREVSVNRCMQYKGHEGHIRLLMNVCDHCGAQTINQEQSTKNRRAANTLKKLVDRVPSGQDIAAMRHAAKLTQAQAGELFGGGPVAFCKYESDDLIPDEAMSNLLRLAISRPEIIRWLQSEKAPVTVVKTKFDVALPSAVSNLDPGSPEIATGTPDDAAGDGYAKAFIAAVEPGFAMAATGSPKRGVLN